MNSILVATIICPHCHAELEAERDVCPHCRTSLRKGAGNGEGAGKQNHVLDRPWILLVLLLHVGLLGVPIYLRTRYSLKTRILICLASVAYTVFVVWFIFVVGSYIYRQFTGAEGG